MPNGTRRVQGRANSGNAPELQSNKFVHCSMDEILDALEKERNAGTPNLVAEALAMRIINTFTELEFGEGA